MISQNIDIEEATLKNKNTFLGKHLFSRVIHYDFSGFLVAEYALNKNFKDSSGKHMDGTIHGSKYKFEDDGFITFTNTVSTYITIPEIDLDEWTITAEVKYPSTNNKYAPIVGYNYKNTYSRGNYDWFVGIFEGRPVNRSTRPRVEQVKKGTVETVVFTQKGGYVSVYRGNIKISRQNLNRNANKINQLGGFRSFSSTYTQDSTFRNVCIYNKEFSDKEITELLDIKTAPNLVSRYLLNGTAKDSCNVIFDSYWQGNEAYSADKKMAHFDGKSSVVIRDCQQTHDILVTDFIVTGEFIIDKIGKEMVVLSFTCSHSSNSYPGECEGFFLKIMENKKAMMGVYTSSKPHWFFTDGIDVKENVKYSFTMIHDYTNKTASVIINGTKQTFKFVGKRGTNDDVKSAIGARWDDDNSAKPATFFNGFISNVSIYDAVPKGI